MNKIIEILNNLHDDIDWKNERELIDRGLIDSFDIIALINDLNDAFDVEIELEHLEPDNFNSVEDMARLLKSLGADI